MYRIFADDTLIYDSTLEDYKLGKGSITLELNKSGSFTFSIYPDHFYYESFARLKTVITVYKSGKIVFRGRILSDVTDYWNNKVITCEGELGFLQDSIVRPFTYVGEPWELLSTWINHHNEQVDEFKQFKLGKVTVNDPNGYINRDDEEYKSTFDAMTDHLVETLGGYLYITHGEDGTDPIPTLNYLADFEKVSPQKIEFGSNLQNYTKTVKANDIATAIIPLGATIDDGDSETTDYRLTIASVNDGLDYVYNETGVALYGWIFKVVSWDDITSEFELKRKAYEYLNENIGQQNTISLNAVDLHLLDPTIESINVGEYVRVISTPHDTDITLLCSGQTIDLLKPENDSFTLGHTFTTISELNSEILKNIKSQYVTNTRFTREFSKTSSLIEQTEERIKLEVDTTYVHQTELDSLEERLVSQISVESESILLNVAGTYTTKTAFKSYQDEVSAKLELKLGKDENDKVVSMLNASADIITINSNRLIINSTYFNLSADGTITATKGFIGDCELVDGKFIAKKLQTEPTTDTRYSVTVDDLGVRLEPSPYSSTSFVTKMSGSGFSVERNGKSSHLGYHSLAIGMYVLTEEKLGALLALLE